MEKSKDYSKDYYFPIKDIDKEAPLEYRVSVINELSERRKNTLKRILKFIYLTTCSDYVSPGTVREYENHLTDVEKIIANRFAIRCSGNEKANYGINSVLAFKRDKYACVICKLKDVRCLEIDHIPEKVDEKGNKTRGNFTIDEFQILCANHHKIKTENQRRTPASKAKEAAKGDDK